MRISGLFSFVICAAWVVSCYAANTTSTAATTTATPCVVGYVDVDVISKESVASKALHDQFQKKQEELQAMIHGSEEKLRKAMKDLEDKRTVLSTEAFAKKQEEIEDMKRQLSEDVIESRTFLEKNYMREIASVGEITGKVVTDEAGKAGVAVVVAKAGILYPRTLTDDLKEMTNQVLDGINKVLPTYKVVFEGEEELMKKKNAKK